MADNTNTEQSEDNTLTDQWGNKRDIDTERYPEDSAARQGKHTPPSGRGGMTPKARPDHQDMFPANPPPSEHARKKGEENDRVARGEVSPVNPEGTEYKGPTKASVRKQPAAAAKEPTK